MLMGQHVGIELEPLFIKVVASKSWLDVFIVSCFFSFASSNIHVEKKNFTLTFVYSLSMLHYVLCYGFHCTNIGPSKRFSLYVR